MDWCNVDQNGNGSLKLRTLPRLRAFLLHSFRDFFFDAVFIFYLERTLDPPPLLLLRHLEDTELESWPPPQSSPTTNAAAARILLWSAAGPGTKWPIEHGTLGQIFTVEAANDVRRVDVGGHPQFCTSKWKREVDSSILHTIFAHWRTQHLDVRVGWGQ